MKQFRALIALAVLLYCRWPVSAATHYVAQNNATSAPPYASWNTAATNIQDAINAASNGDQILVTNGVYAHGGISMDGVITNCVSVNKALLVQSINGPRQTIIQGAWDPSSTNGPGAIRCAWLTNNATLSGFTLQGGATRSGSGTASTEAGGVYATATNAVVNNCVIATNFCSYIGGGAYKASLLQCTLTGNQAGSYGGGAYACNLRNCLITYNLSVQNNGGGTVSCFATNCAYTFNSSLYDGGAAYEGSLINCTVTENLSSGYSSGFGAAVYGATLVNSIVYGNFSRTSYPNTNYASCTMTYCDAAPVAAGSGNTNVNPQFLADGIHLASTSPCVGAGTASVVSGTDIDGQPWNNPPSIGCDEWQPAPVIATQPAIAINSPAFGLTVNTVVAGQSPFTCFWSLNGTNLQDDGHYVNSSTPNLIVNNFGPGDAGQYQVVVSNAVGVVTSQVAQVAIHVVNATGLTPVAPYSTWVTAATNIQDAIDVAAAGDIVLVTNGLYTYGGAAVTGNLTNRVALRLPMTVISANGYAVTTIQGARDPATTNGPAAIRCAYVADGAALTGFTLQNGATRATGDSGAGGPLESGGGVWCNSANGVVANCLLTNNCAMNGGGIIAGTLNDSLVTYNQAFSYGGGAYYASLNNCTVVHNYADTRSPSPLYGAGTYYGAINNGIVLNNYDNAFVGFGTTQVADNYYPTGPAQQFNNSCTSPIPNGGSNTNVAPQFLDLFHLAATSPCRGAGNMAYATGTDLDGQPWQNPPSMGCSEVVVSNLAGSLSVTVTGYGSTVLPRRALAFWGNYIGHATASQWSFGDGQTATNAGLAVSHAYTVPGNYNLTFTVYNNDNPAGVSASTNLQVVPINMPQLQSSGVLTNGFQFQFLGQNSGFYIVQYTTSLTPPVTWNTFQEFFATNGWYQITDTAAPTGTRFYRVEVQ